MTREIYLSTIRTITTQKIVNYRQIFESKRPKNNKIYQKTRKRALNHEHMDYLKKQIKKKARDNQKSINVRDQCFFHSSKNKHLSFVFMALRFSQNDKN